MASDSPARGLDEIDLSALRVSAQMQCNALTYSEMCCIDGAGANMAHAPDLYCTEAQT